MFEGGCMFDYLVAPGVEYGEGTDYETGTGVLLCFLEMSNEGNGL